METKMTKIIKWILVIMNLVIIIYLSVQLAKSEVVDIYSIANVGYKSEINNIQNMKNITIEGAHEETINSINKILSGGIKNIAKEELSDLWFMKGTSYVGLRMYREAIKSFDEAIKYNPDNLESYTNKSFILNQEGKYREAIKICEFVIAKEEWYLNAHINKGYGLLGLKKYEEAGSEFDKALLIDSKNINTYVGKAKAYSGMGEHGKAIKIYDYLLIKGNARQMSAVKKLKDEEMEKLAKKAKGYEDIGIFGRRW